MYVKLLVQLCDLIGSLIFTLHTSMSTEFNQLPNKKFKSFLFFLAALKQEELYIIENM